MTQKRNVVLYLDSELVEKTKELGFNLSKTFENHLKQLIIQLQLIIQARRAAEPWQTLPSIALVQVKAF